MSEAGKVVYLINGPNLGRLGKRQPEIYGAATLEEIENEFSRLAESKGYSAVCVQSDSEEEIIAAIHEATEKGAAIVINPAAFTHYSYAIADALAQAPGFVVEVHISNPSAREEWRRRSVVSPYVTGTIAGFGKDSYMLALEAVVAAEAGAASKSSDRSR